MIALGFTALFLAAVAVAVGGMALYKLLVRFLDLLDRRQAVVEQRARSLVPPSIPPELQRRIMKWTDPSAQESERAAILGLYEEFRDKENPWTEVKRHLAPEPREDVDSPLLMS